MGHPQSPSQGAESSGLAPSFSLPIGSDDLLVCLSLQNRFGSLAVFDLAVSDPEAKASWPQAFRVPGWPLFSCHLLEHRFQVSSSIIFSEPKHIVSIGQKVPW
jgi:hypothetical protein